MLRLLYKFLSHSLLFLFIKGEPPCYQPKILEGWRGGSESPNWRRDQRQCTRSGLHANLLRNWLHFSIREVGWVRLDTLLTIRVKVWGQGSCGAEPQRLRWLRCRTQPGLSPVSERTSKLTPPHVSVYSITVSVVQIFGRSPCLLWQPWLVCLRLTWPLLWSIGFNSDRTHWSPVRTWAPDSHNFSISCKPSTSSVCFLY